MSSKSTNHLNLIADFDAVLSNYHISDDSKKILEKTELILMVGATSSGRNTTIRELVKTGKYYFIISDTTRQPRINDGVLEQNGIEYWFRTEEEMLEDLISGKFLEAEVLHRQQVSGISIRELKNAHDAHKVAVTDVDIGGIHNIVKAKPDTIALMLLPPSFHEWQTRITQRGNMHSAEHRRRVETATRVFQAGLDHDYFNLVIADAVPHAVKQVQEIVRDGSASPELQRKAREVLENLLTDTRVWLMNNP